MARSILATGLMAAASVFLSACAAAPDEGNPGEVRKLDIRADREAEIDQGKCLSRRLGARRGSSANCKVYYINRR